VSDGNSIVEGVVTASSGPGQVLGIAIDVEIEVQAGRKIR
jgi:hypothetical protein